MIINKIIIKSIEKIKLFKQAHIFIYNIYLMIIKKFKHKHYIYKEKY